LLSRVNGSRIGFVGQHGHALLQRERQDAPLEAIMMRVHHVQRHSHGTKMAAALRFHFQHMTVNCQAFVVGLQPGQGARGARSATAITAEVVKNARRFMSSPEPSVARRAAGTRVRHRRAGYPKSACSSRDARRMRSAAQAAP
jgi:hypothetical protein